MAAEASPSDLDAFILAGGASRRFGSDKALALLNGKPLIVRLADQLGAVARSVTAVADRPDKYRAQGIATIADRRPGEGPVAGLEAALVAASSPWILLVSCDLLRLDGAWVRQLERARRGARAVCFGAGIAEPFPALVHGSALPSVRRYLDRGRRSLRGALEGLEAHVVPFPEGWPERAQVNTRSELAAAVAAMGRGD